MPSEGPGAVRLTQTEIVAFPHSWPGRRAPCGRAVAPCSHGLALTAASVPLCSAAGLCVTEGITTVQSVRFWPLSDECFPLCLVTSRTWRAVARTCTERFETLTTSSFCFWSKQLKDLAA